MPPPAPTTPDGSPAGIATTLRDAPLPSESTIRRVLKDLDPGDLDARLTSWFFTRTGAIGGRTVIAVDGKTM